MRLAAWLAPAAFPGLAVANDGTGAFLQEVMEWALVGAAVLSLALFLLLGWLGKSVSKRFGAAAATGLLALVVVLAWLCLWFRLA